jgi:hypothetical protein
MSFREDYPNAEDIGHGVLIARMMLDGTLEGIAYAHPCGNDPEHSSYIPVHGRNDKGWRVVSKEPLTISPSLLCRRCGHHGFIRAGRWVPA